MLEQYDDILTILDLAEALKIGSTQAYRLVRAGKIKAFKSGKDWKFPDKQWFHISVNRATSKYSTLFSSYFVLIHSQNRKNKVKIGSRNFFQKKSFINDINLSLFFIARF